MDQLDAQIADLVTLVDEMYRRSGDHEQSFSAEQWTLKWLSSSVPALGGSTPFAYLLKPGGFEVVRKLLRQMESGAYA